MKNETAQKTIVGIGSALVETNLPLV